MSTNPFLKKQPKKPPKPDNPFLVKQREDAEAHQRENKDNPFLRAPKGKGKKKPKGQPKVSEQEWEAKRTEARLIIRQKGLKVGDHVRVTWPVDRAYGEHDMSHEGTIDVLDDNWLECKPFSTSNGVLKIPLTAVGTIERIEKTEPKKGNPFLK